MVNAEIHLRALHGGAQSRLFQCNDGLAYVVKFQNNPQHSSVLVNEWLGTHIAAALGVSVAPCEGVQVSRELIARDELRIDLGGRSEPCKPGLHFGSQFVGGLMPGMNYDFLPQNQFGDVVNLNEFIGILVFDKWTNNADGRQAVFHKRIRDKKYVATFIDQGYCFNAGERRLADGPLRGVFGRDVVYRSVDGWISFEPWLSHAEHFDENRLWEIAKSTPQEWYNGDEDLLSWRVDQLVARRSRLRELITQFRDSCRNPFPRWEKKTLLPGPLKSSTRSDITDHVLWPGAYLN